MNQKKSDVNDMNVPFGIFGLCLTLAIAGGAAEAGKMWVAAAFAVSSLVIFGALLLAYINPKMPD